MKSPFVKNTKAFTMIETLLTMAVLAVITIVAVPIVNEHFKRTRMAEALATATRVRTAMNAYHARTGKLFWIVGPSGKIQKNWPQSVDGSNNPIPPSSGIKVDAGVAQYFSNDAFFLWVSTAGPGSGNFTNPGVVDFLIIVDGNFSAACANNSTGNCAVKASEVRNYRLVMDNTGRSFASYNGGLTYKAF